jgi:hypothetical protein
MRGAVPYLLLLMMGMGAAAAAAWLVVGPSPPTTPNLALFLALLVPAVAGLSAPVLGLLHRRFPFGGHPPTASAALRQGLFLGLGLAVAALLQLLDLLDATLVLAIGALVVLAELFVQSGRRP